MAKSSVKTAPAKGSKPARPSITIERARLLCPKAGIAEKVASAYGLSVPDFEGIQDAKQEALHIEHKAFDGALNEKATMMHFQRIVGSSVSSALGAGRFYSEKVSEAKNATAKLSSDHRDEDRDAPVGFDSKAQRTRQFAADMAMQAYALLAAAEGALIAYKEITGEDWKAYDAPAEGASTVERRSATAELSAFEG